MTNFIWLFLESYSMGVRGAVDLKPSRCANEMELAYLHHQSETVVG